MGRKWRSRAWIAGTSGAVLAMLVGVVAVVRPDPVAAAACGAGDLTWDGGAGTTSAATAANWSPDAVPSSSTYLCVTGGESIVLDSTGNDVDGLPSFAAKGITSNGTVTQPPGIRLYLTGTAESRIQNMVFGDSWNNFSHIVRLGSAGTGTSSQTAPTYIWGPIVNEGVLQLTRDIVFKWQPFTNGATGTVNQSASVLDCEIAFGVGRVVELANAGTWNLTMAGTPSQLDVGSAPGPMVMGSGCRSFVNLATGQIIRSGADDVAIHTSLTNDGLVRTTSGSLSISASHNSVGALPHHGVFTADAGTRIDLYNGHRFALPTPAPAAPFQHTTGAGTVRLISGLFDLDPDTHFGGNVEIRGSRLAGSGIFDTKVTMAGGCGSSTAWIVFGGGFATGMTQTWPTFGGGLDVRVPLVFSGGDIDLRIPTGATLRVLDNCGGIWLDRVGMGVEAGDRITNHGTIVLDRSYRDFWLHNVEPFGTDAAGWSTNSLTGNPAAPTSMRLINNGTIRSAGSGIQIVHSFNYEPGPNARLEAGPGAGPIRLHDGANASYSAGTLGGGTYEVAHANDLLPLSEVGGAKPVSVNDATLVIHGSGVVGRNIGSGFTAPAYSGIAGTLFDGAASVTNRGKLKLLDNATYTLPSSVPFSQTAAGELTLGAGSTLVVQGSATFAGKLVVSGPVVPGGARPLVHHTGSSGTFAQADVTLPAPAPGTVLKLDYAPAQLRLLELPADPSDVTVDGTAAGSLAATVRWVDNSSNETGFKVYRRVNGTSAWGAPVSTTAANATSYTDAVAAPGRYDYQVVATDAAGDSGSASKLDTAVGIPLAPLTVSALGAEGTLAATVTWSVTNPSAAPAASYKVYRRPTGTTAWGSPIATVAAPATSYGDTVGSARLYDYSVIAVNAAGESTRTTRGSVGVNKPATPASLDVTPATGSLTVPISWTAGTPVDAPATSYRVYRRVNGTTAWGSPIATIAAPGLSTSDTVPAAGRYDFAVAAVNAAGESAKLVSLNRLIALPSAPSGAAITVTPGSRTVTVSWTLGSPSAATEGIKVYRRRGGAAAWTLLTPTPLAPTTTTLTDTVPAVDGYQYAVTAVNTVGESAKREDDHIGISPPAAPASVTATAEPGQLAANVKWVPGTPNDAPATGFLVYRAAAGTNNWTLLTPTPLAAGMRSFAAAAPAIGRYDFAVVATNLVGESSRSLAANVGVGVPSAPGGVTIGVAAGTVTMTWTNTSVFGSNFVVQRRVKVGTVFGAWSAATVATSPYTDAPGVGVYQYRVRAVTSVGSSAWVTKGIRVT